MLKKIKKKLFNRTLCTAIIKIKSMELFLICITSYNKKSYKIITACKYFQILKVLHVNKVIFFSNPKLKES